MLRSVNSHGKRLFKWAVVAAVVHLLVHVMLLRLDIASQGKFSFFATSFFLSLFFTQQNLAANK